MSKSIYWLNEESRAFLKRGYLPKGVTPEARIRRIAEYAEEILRMVGFADTFESYLHKGWYSLSSPVWSNFGAGRGLSISCVTGDTWINTKTGGKQAQDVVAGDEVLTHKGRFRKVEAITVTPDKADIYCLKVMNRMTPIRLTGNHLVMTNLGWIRTDQLDPKRHLVAINGQVEHEGLDYVIDMEPFCDYPHHISSDGLIQKTLTPKLQRQTGRETSEAYVQVRKLVQVDLDLAWAIGLWFAEGSITVNDQKKPNGIRITLSSDEQHLADRWLKVMTERFNLHGKDYHSTVERPEAPVSKMSRWITVNLNGGAIGSLFASFGKGCKEKTLPDWIMSLPFAHLQQVLDGILTGDGSFRPKEDSIKLTLANPKLILQVYLIGLKLDREMSLQMQDKPSRYGKTAHVYTILFRNYSFSRSTSRSNAGVRFHDGLVYATIKSLSLTKDCETVYDFTVKEDHSFSVAGVVVHNCNGSFVPDDTDGIFEKVREVGIMTKHGAGTSAYFGAIRARGAAIGDGGVSNGPIPFMRLFDVTTDVVSQSNVRRGQFAAYMPVEHPDIEEFLQIRDAGNIIQKMSLGVTVSDAWMESMIEGDKDKRRIWATILKKRFESGYPYILFSDTINRNAPQVYRDKGMRIHASNLCTEIALASSPTESFVCNLSSMNLLHYEDWKGTDAVKLLTYFLDAVMTDYIDRVKDIPAMKAAHTFATNQRALGIGVLGWHSFLQSKLIAFESTEAKLLNTEIHRTIRDESVKASRELANLYGEPPLLKGYGLRNVTTMAIAPTTSSSFILGQVSPSIEPLHSNYFLKDLAKGKFPQQNPYLQKVLEAYGKDTKATWDSILKSGGSVQHLAFLTSHEREVFKTFGEISQMEVIIQAAARQKYIDQTQSLNLMIHPKTPLKDVNKLVTEAWKLGCASLYYQRGTNPAQELGRANLFACSSCEA